MEVCEKFPKKDVMGVAYCSLERFVEPLLYTVELRHGYQCYIIPSLMCKNVCYTCNNEKPARSDSLPAKTYLYVQLIVY